MEQYFTDILGKEIYGDSWTPETNKQIYQEGELEKKLLSGYWYRLGSSSGEPLPGHRKVLANTGIGGAKKYIQACKRQGMMDEDWIASSIEVYIDGQYVKMTDPRLKHVNLKDAEKNTGTEENTDAEG